MNELELKEFLDEKYHQFNVPSYIDSDPIQIPHQYSKKEDIEISAFLTSTIAWGQRKTIIKNAFNMMHLMDNQPHEFLLNASKKEINGLNNFSHRTFNNVDFKYYIKALQYIYKKFNGLESFFKDEPVLINSIINLRKAFFEPQHEKRTEKHFPDITSGSAAKRLNMFLRWMVRKDKIGVDFGLWNSVNPSNLFIPIDVHVGNVARKLGMLKRKQNDWKAVKELTCLLKKFDPEDPVKYDYALFGLGVFEKF